MRRKSSLFVISIASLFILLVIGCNGNDTITRVPNIQADTSQATFVNRVSYCWTPSSSPKRTRVQVLLDASGSMVGHEESMNRLISWMRLGVSQLMGPMIQLPEGGFTQAHFSQQRGFFNQTGWNESPASFDAGGDTNLHEALRRSEDAELTFILTDGVAATGGAGSGPCPGGVDASCVADMMSNVARGGTNRGIWIVPLVSMYDGIFYTERISSPESFGAKSVVKQVESEMGGSVSVQGISTDNQGRLTYDYSGPRTSLLIVLSKDLNVGRAAVHALWENTQMAGFQQAEHLKNVQGATDPTVMRPFEVYPGFVNRTDWTGLDRIDDPSQFKDPIEVGMELGGRSPTVQVQCVPNQASYGLYRLTGRTASNSGSCTQLRVLPGFTFRMQATSQEDESALRGVLNGYRRPSQEKETSTVDLQLTCNSGTSTASLPSCSDPLSARWVAYTDYGAGASCLDSENCTSEQHQAVEEMSTVDPAQRPHRIFGFNRLLTLFYRQVSKDERRITLAPINFCMSDGQAGLSKDQTNESLIASGRTLGSTCP